jgi:phosphoribosylamine--glycine ligase
LQAQVMREIVEPTVRTMAAEAMPYSGVLYAGLMLTKGGPQLIEYNARFGDPECQVLMMRLESDLVELMQACARKTLGEVAAPVLSDDFALTVVLAAEGYPGTPKKGGTIDLGEAEANGAKVFHAGTKLEGETLTSSGGRVLNVTARGASATEAQRNAYEAVDAIDFADGFCRRDIGQREVRRERG